MHSEIQKFTNEQFGTIRSVVRDGKPWFVGRDVALALGYSNPRKALADHVDAEDKGVTKCDTLGGAQDFTIINESGLYALILSSKLREALRGQIRLQQLLRVLPGKIQLIGQVYGDLSGGISDHKWVSLCLVVNLRGWRLTRS